MTTPARRFAGSLFRGPRASFDRAFVDQPLSRGSHPMWPFERPFDQSSYWQIMCRRPQCVYLSVLCVEVGRSTNKEATTNDLFLRFWHYDQWFCGKKARGCSRFDFAPKHSVG